MNLYFIGELYALGVAVSDATACACFNIAEKKISTFAVNFLKTIAALISAVIIRLVLTGKMGLHGIDPEAWICFSISGIMGFVIGDYFHFYSFLFLPYRVSMMVFNCGSIVTALAAWGLYGQVLQLADWLGIGLISIGLCTVLLTRKNQSEEKAETKKMWKGIFFAAMGMLGQASGALFSNRGMRIIEGTGVSALDASLIRIVAGIIVLMVLLLIQKKKVEVYGALKYSRELILTGIGGISGCAVGTTLTLQSIRYIPVGISTAIASISPVLILLATILFSREKIKLTEIIGTFICVAGIVALSI